MNPIVELPIFETMRILGYLIRTGVYLVSISTILGAALVTYHMFKGDK